MRRRDLVKRLERLEQMMLIRDIDYYVEFDEEGHIRGYTGHAMPISVFDACVRECEEEAAKAPRNTDEDPDAHP
jgi:hypothetical protein